MDWIYIEQIHAKTIIQYKIPNKIQKSMKSPAILSLLFLSVEGLGLKNLDQLSNKDPKAGFETFDYSQFHDDHRMIMQADPTSK